MLHSVEGDRKVFPQNPKKYYPVPKKEEEGSARGVSYSSDTVSLSYKNGNGEELTISMKHEELHAFDITSYSDGDKEKWQGIVENIKEEWAAFKESVVQSFLEGAGVLPKEDKEPSEVEENEEASEGVKTLIDILPDYWKPDAVADRIFEFTTAYYGQTESDGEDFYKLARNAILQGFGEAREEVGQLPQDIEGVIEETRRLLMEKLDRWAEDQGILPDSEASQNSKAPEGGIDISA